MIVAMTYHLVPQRKNIPQTHITYMHDVGLMTATFDESKVCSCIIIFDIVYWKLLLY